MNIHPCRTMRLAEAALFESGRLSSFDLMQQAIRSAVDLLGRDAEFAHAAERFQHVIVYVGKGKNGGDAIGIARCLGIPRITLRCAVRPCDMAPESQRILNAAGANAPEIADTPPALPPEGAALLIDGLLGSGASGPLRPEYATLVEELNTLRMQCPRSATLAVDIPTGLTAHTVPGGGATPGPAVRADATLAIGCVKPDMLADGAEDYVGRLLCVPLPEVALPDSPAQVLDAATLSWLPRRAFSCFKNRAGRVRIIAGSPGYIGAADMCSRAALRAGAGLVELYCLPSIYPILATRLPAEIMVREVSAYREVPADGADAMLIGPGLGKPGAEDAQAICRLIEQPPCPLVLDADGLNLAAAARCRISPRCILTPHPGEMQRLFPEAAQLTRAECTARYVAQQPCTLLLKGARTLITDGAHTFYNSTGGPHMANGGQGDVLSGVIAALVAQGLAPLRATALAAYACGRAADHQRAAAGFPHAVSATQLLHSLFI